MKMNLSSVFEPKLIECMKGYNKSRLTTDIMAGIIVGIVAIPLAIAFGIASGVGPTEGLVTAIIAGFIISAFGGTRVQIGGPTGAFIVIIYGIIQEFGLAGLMIATIMAGILLILMGVLKLGSVIKFIPYPIVVGFTAGIALTIFSTQMNDFFGLGIDKVPANFIDKWICYAQNFTSIDPISTAIAVGSLLIIIFTPFIPGIGKKLPGSLIAIIVATLASWILKTNGLGDSIMTIGDLYELPHGIPAPHLPSLQLGEDQTVMDMLSALFPVAFTIAMLGAIESLLSATVADGVIGDKHNSNTELIAQGVANIATPFFGGIPATGAIARTMANINNGGRTPVAGMVHAVVLTLVLLFLGGLVGMIPMSCLAAVLVMVSYNMSGWRTIKGMLHDPKGDLGVMFLTFALTVIFDLTVAIEVGMLLALVLFLQRISEATAVKQLQNKVDPSAETDAQLHEEALLIPKGCEVYEIAGPFFFGVANKFDDMVKWVGEMPKVRIIRMRRVPFIDATGIHNLEILIERSHASGTIVVLSGVNKEVEHALHQHGLHKKLHEGNICPNINVALERAKEIIGE